MQKQGVGVDYVSPKVGFVPLDPRSMRYTDESIMKIYESRDFIERGLRNSLAPKDVNSDDYSAAADKAKEAINNATTNIVCGKTDLRKGKDGLATLIKEQFDLDPFSGQYSCFVVVEMSASRHYTGISKGFGYYTKDLKIVN